MTVAGTTQVHLVGGGPDSLQSPTLLSPFVEAAQSRAGRQGSPARIALVLADDNGLAAKFRAAYIEPLEALASGRFDLLDLFIDGATPVDPAVFGMVDGIVVGGGPTPVYLDALVPVAPAVRSAVAAGVPYVGFSAGAMVAASTALAGGWRQEGRAVCGAEWSEGLGDLQLRQGLGLVPFTVDVHATQGGLLSRAASLPMTAGVEQAVGIDEGTCLSALEDAEGSRLEVRGSGFVWQLTRADDDAVLLRRLEPH